jgi:endonuclease/exonuclease/phosphatase family metal-dependent hydrolase
VRHAARSLLVLALAVVLAACGDNAPDPLAPDGPDDLFLRSDPVVVMSRNMYLGADIDVLLGGGDPTAAVAAAYQQLVINNAGNFGRALGLAAEIAGQRPHLVGLQEVSRYELSPDGLNWTTLVDYVDALQAYLAFLGMAGQYEVAVRQANISLTLPLVIGGVFQGFIRYTDGEAILVRTDVDWSDPAADHFDAQVQLSVGGITFDNLRGWNAVTARVDGHAIRFVNTHLEIQRFAAVQEEQARELVDLFQGEDMPVVMAGDFNSAANPDATQDQRTDSYSILRRAGYADLWLRGQGAGDGLTCCFSSILTDPDPSLHARLDLVMARYGPAGFPGYARMEVLGEEPADRITVNDAQLGTLQLWPSDHAGVVAWMWPAPGKTVTN